MEVELFIKNNFSSSTSSNFNTTSKLLKDLHDKKFFNKKNFFITLC